MARSAEETRIAKRDAMRVIRADPARREEINRRRRGLNLEERREQRRTWTGRHFFRYRAQLHRMRHGVPVTGWELARLWIEQRGHCALTGWPLRGDAHLDHVLPIARGGGHGIENLRWLDPGVNRAKRDLTDAEFRALCAAVLT